MAEQSRRRVKELVTGQPLLSNSREKAPQIQKLSEELDPLNDIFQDRIPIEGGVLPPHFSNVLCSLDVY